VKVRRVYLMMISSIFILTFAVLARGQSKSENPVQTLPAAESSARTPAPVQSSEASVENFQFPVLRTFGGLGLVLCLIIGGFLAARKLAPQYFSRCPSQKNLKIIETLPMGDKRSISLIEVANSRYLIGNTPHQINFLTKLPESLSFVPEINPAPAQVKRANKKGSKSQFQSLFEVERGSSSIKPEHPLPDDLRTKMRQMREALERG
jgi:flagellar biosynthetic protein FliO